MSQGLKDEFQLDSVYVVEALSGDSKVERGTCFLISKDLVLTANHVIKKASLIKIFLTSDDYSSGTYVEAECIYMNEGLDFAILKISDKSQSLSKSVSLFSTKISLDTEVRSCGYPVEKEHYCTPINVRITNTFDHMRSNEYSFEVSQTPNVSRYQGMSGSPIFYQDSCIGLLLAQQGSNTLYAISIKDMLIDESVRNIFDENEVQVSIQQGIEYEPPICPPSPFTYRINCNKGLPNIKGIEIGFSQKQWNVGLFSERIYDWLIDYSLSHKEKSIFKDSQRRAFKHARSKYEKDDLNALGDLCLHIAIRETYSTIPIVNKAFDLRNKNFSCTHVVLNTDQLELWIGASSVCTTLEEAVQVAVDNIKYITSIDSLQNRLIMLTSEIDETWPYKEKLERIADDDLNMDDRFDKIIIPIFIMHNSEIITNYDKNNFTNLLSEKIQECRELLATNITHDLINVKVFYFPALDVNQLNSALAKELNS